MLRTINASRPRQPIQSVHPVRVQTRAPARQPLHVRAEMRPGPALRTPFKEAQLLVKTALERGSRAALDTAWPSVLLGVCTHFGWAATSSVAFHVAGVATALWFGGNVLQGWHRVFSPVLYWSKSDLFKQANIAWAKRRKDEALRYLTYAARASDDYFSTGISSGAESSMLKFALKHRAWEVVDMLLEGHRWEQRFVLRAMQQAVADGVGDKIPLWKWSQRIWISNEDPLTLADFYILGDLLAGAALPPPADENRHERAAKLLHVLHEERAGRIDRGQRNHLLVAIDQLGWQTPGLRSALDEDGPSRRVLLTTLDAAHARGLSESQIRLLCAHMGKLVWTPAQEASFSTTLQAFRVGRQSLNDVFLSFADYAIRSHEVEAATAQRVLALWTTGDVTGALHLCRQLRSDDDRGRWSADITQRILDGVPRAALGLFRAAMARGDQDAIANLMPVMGRWNNLDERMRLFDQLIASDIKSFDPWAFVKDGKVPLHRLSDAHLDRMMSGRHLAPRHDSEPEVVALANIAVRFGGTPQAHAMLQAWRAGVRTPDFIRVFSSIDDRKHGEVYKQLADQHIQGSISAKGLLLAVNLVPALGDAVLHDPRLQLLLRSNYIVRSEQRLRRVLAAVCSLRTDAPGNALSRLLTWPNDTALRTWLGSDVDALRAQHVAALQAWPDTERSSLRHVLDRLSSRWDTLCAHAHHVHAQGDGAGVIAYLELLQDQLAQRHAYLTDLVPRLPNDAAQALSHLLQLGTEASPHVLQNANKALTQAGRSVKEPELAELTKHACTLSSAWVQGARALRQMHAPVPPVPNVARDFFADNTRRGLQEVYSHDVLNEQLDGLSALPTLAVFQDSVQFERPSDLQKQASEALPIAHAHPEAFAKAVQTFRQERLFWRFVARMHRADSGHREGLQKILRAWIEGSYDVTRRDTEQMRKLFGQGSRDALRSLWEAGARDVVANAGPYAGRTLEDTGAFVDFASSGDEISGSCHSLYGGSYCLNLMGRVLCGSKRMLTIKDAAGALMARAMWRLMQDDQGQPVLLLSRVYTRNVATQEAQKTLEDFAVARGRALGLPVVSAFAQDTDTTPHMQVSSHPGAVKEYWDERGTQVDARVLWAPEEHLRAA